MREGESGKEHTVAEKRKKAKKGNDIFYLTMSLFKLLFIKREEKKNPSPVGKSGILFLSLSPSVCVRVTGYYSVCFIEKKGGWEDRKGGSKRVKTQFRQR